MSNTCKILIFCIFASIFHSASGQLNSLLEDANIFFPNANDNTIVRNYNNKYAIGALHDGNNYVLYSTAIEAFTDPSSTLPLTSGTRSPMLAGYTVKDLKIYGDVVFICGTEPGGNGYYAFFSAPSIVSTGVVPITEYKLISLQELSKFIIVRKATGVGIVGIGKIDSGDCIVEVPQIGIPNYYFGLLPTSSETLQDVMLVGKEVVFTGMIQSSETRALYVRKSSAINVLGGPDLSTMYTYIPTNPAYQIQGVIVPTSSTVVDDRFVAIAHQCSAPSVPSVITNVSVIDISSMNIVNTHCYHNGNRASLGEMTYLSTPKQLVLPMNQELVSFNPSINTPYVTTLLNTNLHYTSTHSVDMQNVIAAGRSQWFLQRVSSSGLGQSCHPGTTVPITLMPYRKNVTERPLIIFPGTIGYATPNSISSFMNIIINCQYQLP